MGKAFERQLEECCHTESGVGVCRNVIALALSAVLVGMSAAMMPVPGLAQTAPVATQDYAIPAGNLKDGLDALASQGRVSVLFSPELVANRVTRGVSGRYTSTEALRRLLDGSGLESNLVDATTYVLRPSAAPSPGSAESSSRKISTNENQEDEETQDMPTVMVHRPFTDANVDIVRTEKDVQPYYIFSGEEIAQANAVNLETFLKQRLSMNAVSYSPSQDGGNNTTASRLNLRGLGENQTLILVNGRRTSGSGSDFFPFDLNTISPSQIERIEVLPTSASSIYGGNAIGGVLNIVLKRDFQGGEISFTYDTPMDTDAPVRSVSAGYGWSLEQGRTNITVRASYRDSDILRLGDRRQLAERGFSRMLSWAPELVYQPGDPYSFGTTPNIGSVNGEPLVFKEGGPLGGTSLGSALTFVPVGTSPGTSLADLQAALLVNAGRQNTDFPDILGNAWPANSALLTPLINPDEAYSVMGAVRRKMTDRLELIAEVYFNSNKTVKQAPGDTYFYVPADSPANPFQQDVYVPAPLANATELSAVKRENVRAVAGFVFDLPGDWRAQGDYTWSRMHFSAQFLCFDCASGGQALPAALAEGTLNPFVDTLGFPLDMSPYLSAANRTSQIQKSPMVDVGLRVSGPVGALPAGRPNLTVGLGHRDEEVASYVVDQAGYGRFSYFPQSQRISSLYAEGLIPLLKNLPGARLLELQIASRLEDFSVDSNGWVSAVTCPAGSTSCTPTPDSFAPEYSKTGYRVITETLGLRYQPVEVLTLRASYATGFLPPGLFELHPQPLDPQFYEFGPDPLRGGEQVRARQLTGGNPDLDPMDSESFNLGVIFEPTFWGLEGLRAGLEWFRIDRRNLVSTPYAEFLLANQERFADRIVRADPEPADPYGVGPITLLDMRVFTANKVSTKGLDINLGYRRPTERHGIFSLDLQATIVESYTVALDLDGNTQEAAGKVHEWFGVPIKLRGNATVGWERGPWSLSWTALYFGQYDQLPLNYGPYIPVQGRTTVPHQIYHNLLVSYRFEDREISGVSSLLSDLTVTLGIRNIFDTLPPLDASNGTNGFYSSFGDPRLRSVQLSVRKAF